MPLSNYEQSELRYALRTGDGRAFADVVRNAYCNYETLEGFVRSQPGGERAVGKQGIRVNNTLVRRYGSRPEVVEE